jgi:hypothetical protein
MCLPNLLYVPNVVQAFICNFNKFKIGKKTHEYLFLQYYFTCGEEMTIPTFFLSILIEVAVVEHAYLKP